MGLDYFGIVFLYFTSDGPTIVPPVTDPIDEPTCEDDNENCFGWAQAGECEAKVKYFSKFFENFETFWKITYFIFGKFLTNLDN